MAKLKGKTRINISEMVQKIDLSEYFERPPTEAEKKNFADMAVERINSRTLSGQDINGNDFKEYTEEYARKKGVTTNSVDLFLKGDMLDSVRRNPFIETNKEVAIELNDPDEALKGFVHHTGDGKAKKREWFGITEEEAREIANQSRAISSTTVSQLQETVNQLGLERRVSRRETTSIADIIEELSKLGIKQVE